VAYVLTSDELDITLLYARALAYERDSGVVTPTTYASFTQLNPLVRKLNYCYHIEKLAFEQEIPWALAVVARVAKLRMLQ